MDSNRLVFKHVNCDPAFIRATFAIELPSREQLVSCVTEFDAVIDGKLGVTWVHPKDQYVKTIGKQKAYDALTSQALELQYVENRYGRLVFHFTTLVVDPRPNQMWRRVELGVSLVKESNHPRLEYICFGEQ